VVGKLDLVQKSVNHPLAPAIQFFHRRWSVPIISRLHTRGALRFTDLARALRRASRDTLAETLHDLEANGVVERALDGRYRLTAMGRKLGDAAVDAASAVTDRATGDLALKKWPMLVLVAIGRGHCRFNEIKAALPGITSGALAPTLKDLQAAGLVERDVEEGYPPLVAYRLTPAGWTLFPPMDAIIRAAEEAAAEL
jgi:DNA-binding HxlR family transcriptional regulator